MVDGSMEWIMMRDDFNGNLLGEMEKTGLLMTDNPMNGD